MIDITPLVNALIAVAAVLITVFLIPWIKSRTTTAQREEHPGMGKNRLCCSRAIV